MCRRWVIALLLLMLVAGCAPGVNPEVGTPDAERVIAGFWLGLWHGVIAPVTFVISLFIEDINIYEVHNSGNWYDFGFMLGIGALAGGGSSGSRYGRRR